MKLGQLREGAPVQDVVDRLLVRWTHNTEPVPNLDDQFVWSAPIDDAGRWDAEHGIWLASIGPWPQCVWQW